jgi:hypothetical protein
MKDFLIDSETGDLAFANGDIKTGESDQQHQRLLLMTGKGAWKEFPATGVGAASFLEAEDPAGFLREVKAQFTADGMRVKKIVFENNKLRIDANY